MAGIGVNRTSIDARTSEAIITLRSAFEKIQNVTKFLSNIPVVGGVDPLVDVYGYTTDEAYAIRVAFEGFDAGRIGLAYSFDVGSKLTGLE